MEQRLQVLNEIILGILGIDDAKRRLCELKLEEMKKEPDMLTLSLLKLLQSSPDADHRKLSATLLKRYVSAINNPSGCVWPQLTPDTKKLLKEQLLLSLVAETQPSVARLLCWVVAEVAGTIEHEDSSWPELDAFLHTMITSGTSALQQEMGYLVMNYVFAYVQEKYETHAAELAAMFATSLNKGVMSVQVACVEAMCHLLENMDSTYIGPFVPLLSLVTGVIQAAIKADDDESIKNLLDALTSVADEQTKYFGKNYDQIFAVGLEIAARGCTKGAEDFDEDRIVQMTIELLVTIIERIPSLLTKKAPADYLVPLLKIVLWLTRMIPFEVEADWLKPKATFFFEGEEEEDNINFGKRAVDRILSCAKEREEGLGLTLIGPLLMEYFANDADWRYKHAALLAACNVGEYIEDPISLSGLIPIVVQHVTHPHPRVRYAAVHCLGQIADDCEDDFHVMYHEKVMAALMAGLDDPIARVQRHTCAAMCNFIDKLQQELVDKYVTNLMLKLGQLMKTSEPIVQEYIMSVIGSIAEATPDTFKTTYYDETMPFLVNVLQSCKDYKYKKLRGHTIECITIVARSVGKKKFKTHMNDVIRAMYQIQENELESQDPQKCFLLSAWQRLCLILKKDMVPYMEMLIPSLLKLAASVPGLSIGTNKDATVELEKAARELSETGVPEKEEKRKMVHVTTTDIEEKEAAINMLGVLIDELGGYLDRYVENFSQIVLNVLVHSGVQNLREAAAMTLKGLIKAAKNGKNIPMTQEYLSRLARTYLEALLKSALDEYDVDPLTVEMEAMTSVLEEAGKCLDPPAIQKLFETAMKLIEDSNKRIQVNKDQQQEDDEDADDAEVELMKADNKKEKELQLEVIQVVGSLFKSHTEEAMFLVNLLYPKYLTETLKPDATNHMHQMGLFVVVDMVEHLGYARIPTMYPEFAELIISYSQSAHPGIRQACMYGIGAIAKNAGEYYPKLAAKCLNALIQGIDAKAPADVKKKYWKSARDNAIASLGKTIKCQGKMLPEAGKAVTFWLERMPLKVDMEEGLLQNESLADMVTADCAAILGPNAENLERVLKIFVDVLDTEQVNDEVSLKISKALNMLAAIPALKDRIAAIGNALSKDDKETLESCLELAHASA